MNCEQCQELIHDLVDGSISRTDESILNTHLTGCLDCDGVRRDLAAIVDFCHKRRGEYEAPPNEQALWVRIRNVIEVVLSPEMLIECLRAAKAESTEAARRSDWKSSDCLRSPARRLR